MWKEQLPGTAIIAIVFYVPLVSSQVSETDGIEFLKRYGYLNDNPHLENIMGRQDIVKGIMQFQSFAGLPETGELDAATLKKMKEPRCGVPDIVGTEAAAKRKKRYALQGCKWNKKQLTYKITSYTRDLQHRVTEKQIANAFKVWEKESRLTFRKRRVTEAADIEIKFESGAHGDGDPFDGRGKILAHAFFPQFGGDAHFDEDEPWAETPEKGVSLFIVAAHEFGHSLGLSHSNVKSALMAPFYNPYYKGLDTDDITGIRKLYGAPTDKNKPSTTRSTTTRRPRLTRPTRLPRPTKATTTDSPPVGACDGRFDAMTMLGNGTTYAFKDGQFWRLNKPGMEKGYPQPTRSNWGFSGKIDAALTYRGFTDFFQGSLVRRYLNGRRVLGYPRSISQAYKGIPSNIDAAYVWSGNGRIYFVKGDQYWRYNSSLRKADNGYPKPLSVWKGLPASLDAALQWNDRTYFFKNGYYWRFDDKKMRVAQSFKAPYPRRSDEWWLGCSDNTLKVSGEDVLAGKEEDDDALGGGATKLFKCKSTLVTASSIIVTASSIIVTFFTHFFL